MKVICVVCDTEVDESEAVAAIEDEEEPLVFCSAECRERFELEPELYLQPDEDPGPGEP